MTQAILVATTNPGKFGEIMEVLAPLQETFGLQFVSLKMLGIDMDCPEDANSYEENAIFKAKFYAQISGLPTIADDSGIQVFALAGELGVRTRRWGAGPQASDEEWLNFFLNRMKQEQDRRATEKTKTILAKLKL